MSDVYGPAAPTSADLAWATGVAQAALDDLPVSSPVRALALEAEAAAYTAAQHLGPEADAEMELGA